MPSVVDTLFTVVGLIFALGVLGLSAARKCVRQYFFVNLYAAVMLLGDGVRYFTLHYYGFRSYHYFYAFYLTDALLVIATYLLILSFFDHIFGNTPLRSQVRWALLFFIILVGLLSHFMMSRSLPHFYSRLLVEFLQNMYFAAVILTALLWISLMHIGVSDRRLGLLIAGLGVSLSAQAANYAVQSLLSREMFEGLQFLMRRVPAVATLTKLGLWCYAMAAVAPEPVPQGEPVLLHADARSNA